MGSSTHSGCVCVVISVGKVRYRSCSRNPSPRRGDAGMRVLKVMEHTQTLYHENHKLRGPDRQAIARNQKDTWTHTDFKEMPETPGAEEVLHCHVREIQVALALAKAATPESENRAFRLVCLSFADEKEHNVRKSFDSCYKHVKEAWALQLTSHYPMVTTLCSMLEEYIDPKTTMRMQRELDAVQ